MEAFILADDGAKMTRGPETPDFLGLRHLQMVDKDPFQQSRY